jgi:hypothetical protein
MRDIPTADLVGGTDPRSPDARAVSGSPTSARTTETDTRSAVMAVCER